jgi:molybdopterin-binding protein
MQWIYTGKVRTTTTEGGHHRVAESEIERLLARYPQSLQGKAGDPNRQKGLIVTLSGRNQLRGFVEEVRSEGLLGQVRLRLGDQVLTAVITSDALAELKLKRGDDALAIVKSTEVMIAREVEQAASRRKRRRGAR